MPRNRLYTLVALLAPAFFATSAGAWPLDKAEIDKCDKVFKYWWGGKLEWTLAKLPKNGTVEKHRLPWSGYIYPDYAGGCYVPLRNYDRAFYPRRYLTSRYERYDQSIRYTPHWSGHCNGWTAAAIRHAEPRKSVKRNGVVLRPADIKGLLAELYVHNDYQPLAGDDTMKINAGVFHVTLANWIGRKKHPIAMDRTPGWEIWNYPVYAYKSSWARRGKFRADVRTNIGYIDMTERPYDKAPVRPQFLRFHYQLYLNEHDQIVGGNYYWDSDQIDLLWVPLAPRQGGTKRNKEGNPYLKVEEVLALWRASVPAEHRETWRNIDPRPQDLLQDGLKVGLVSGQTTAPWAVRFWSASLREDLTSLADSQNPAQANSVPQP